MMEVTRNKDEIKIGGVQKGSRRIVSVNLPPEVLQAIDHLCREQALSRSAAIAQACQQFTSG